MVAPAKTLTKEIVTKAQDSWKMFYTLCGAASWLLMLYSLATIVVVGMIGAAPTNAQEGFDMLRTNRMAGLLRLDVLTIFIIPLYYLIFFGFYKTHRQINEAFAGLAVLLAIVGVTMFLATPSVFSWLSLSDRFAMAVSEAEKSRLLAAGEAILYTDMWHGSGAIVGGLLLQTGALLISIVMLGSKTFGKACAWVGIATHGLDLLHIFVYFISPDAGNYVMMVAGPLYLFWFPLIARGFFRAARNVT